MKWFNRPRQEKQLDRELQFHIDEETARNIAAGLSPEEAHRQAVLAFGGAEQVKEDCRDARRFQWLEQLLQDLRYAGRALRRSPGFTSVVVLSLALGIGANTAIFGLINKVMLQMMPVAEPDRLVRFQKFYSTEPGNISYALFQDLRDHMNSFSSMFAMSPQGRKEIDFGGGPEMAETEVVSVSYYDVLGVSAVVGRTPLSTEGRATVAVISYRYWKSRFNLDPAAVGKTFRLNTTLFTIIGITPRDFGGTLLSHPADITFPLEMHAEVSGHESWLAKRHVNWLSVMARLKPGVSLRQAAEESSAFYRRRLEQEAGRIQNDPRNRQAVLQGRLETRPAGNGFGELQQQFSQPLLALMGTVALVLLIACTNIANLLLARSAARRKEISVRMALGAGRGRLIRQLLSESLVLSIAGGIAGFITGIWLSNFLIRLMSASAHAPMQVKPDLRILLFTAALSLLTCILFGLAPAWQATKVNVTPALKEVAAGGNRWLARTLLIAQISLSLLLLIGAGLFVRTLSNLYHLDAGFEREGVLMFFINADKTGYAPERQKALHLEIVERLNALPGVRSASLSSIPPVSGGGWDGSVGVEGYQHRPDEDNTAHLNSVGPHFFLTLGTPVLLGREFEVRDGGTAPKVAIVNEAFARYYFPGGSPLGRHVNKAEIVGVVRDMKYRSLRQDFPRTVYFPMLQDDGKQLGGQTFYLRTSATPPGLAQTIERTVQSLHPSLRTGEVISLTEHIDRSIVNERMMAMLAGSFGILALVVACLGIYGVLAFQVARRTNEIGIRMALGAQRQDLIWMVLREILALLLMGAAIGIPAALAVTRLAKAMLYGITPSDPTTFAAATAALAAVALAAGYLPARRASLVDPLVALRYD